MKTQTGSSLFVLLAAITLAGSAMLAHARPASAQSGGGFGLAWSTVDGGGATASGGDYVLYGTAGQPDAGMMAGGDFAVQGGFLNASSAPTAVTLRFFSATPDVHAVLLEWETASEASNLGFNLYRAGATPNGELVRLNVALIPSGVPPGSNAGAFYDWLDGDVIPATTYYYWLEMVDIRGQGTRHGPVDATLPPGTGPVLDVYLPIISK